MFNRLVSLATTIDGLWRVVTKVSVSANTYWKHWIFSGNPDRRPGFRPGFDCGKGRTGAASWPIPAPDGFRIRPDREPRFLWRCHARLRRRRAWLIPCRL